MIIIQYEEYRRVQEAASRVQVGVNDLETWCKQNGREDLLREWDYEKNGDLNPTEISRGSEVKVFWVCPKGHLYPASIKERTGCGRGCPYCAGKKVLVGYNDLATTNPEMAKEWDYEKNGELKPTEVSRGSGQSVYWVCPRGHSYTSKITDRSVGGNGCPYCSGRRVLVGYNDLVTTNPEITKEWDYKKNGQLKPTDVTRGSRQSVYWVCPKGHSYSAIISSRTGTGRGKGCPYCAGKKVLVGYNDLATTNPEIAKEWDYKKNGQLKPTDVTRGSRQSVYWVCPKGHSYASKITDRAAAGHGCPYCSGNKVLSGYNDFETWCKQSGRNDLLDEWDYEKNDILPNQTSKGSKQKFFWVCSNGHSFQQSANERTVKDGSGCPICSLKKRGNTHSVNSTMNGNDFETWCKQNGMEHLLDEWDYEKNDVLPSQAGKSVAWKVWWVCPNGHPYEAEIRNRKRGSGCPYCSGNKVLPGVNDFETWCKQNDRQDLLSEWDYNKNDVLPSEVSRGSSCRKVWWVCPKGHSYDSQINSRVGCNSFCPICAQLRTASVPEKLIYFYLNTIIGEQYKIVPNDREALGNKTELDIYIPSLKVAIEYDGVRFHDKDAAKKEVYKNKLCKSKGIDLIRVRENGLSDMSDCYCIIRDNNRSLNDMDECISAVFEYIINLSNIDIPYDIYSTGGEDDFINCKRDMQQAIDLRDSM